MKTTLPPSTQKSLSAFLTNVFTWGANDGGSGWSSDKGGREGGDYGHTVEEFPLQSLRGRFPALGTSFPRRLALSRGTINTAIGWNALTNEFVEHEPMGWQFFEIDRGALCEVGCQHRAGAGTHLGFTIAKPKQKQQRKQRLIFRKLLISSIDLSEAAGARIDKSRLIHIKNMGVGVV